MEDTAILELYWARDEQAIAETQKSYGKYCYSIAYHILHDREDTEECLNDTWMRAWNAIPPKKPNRLELFLGTITRNLSFDRWKAKNAQKIMVISTEKLEPVVSTDRISTAGLSDM